MDSLGIFIWICPVITITLAFFTSGMTAFRFQRYLIYVVILFTAFLFNLQSLSFRSDTIDLVQSQATLFVLADFFWRGVRMKSRILKIGSLILALLFFLIAYRDWILGGPDRVYRFFDSTISDSSPQKLGPYYVKTRGILKVKSGGSDKIVLFRKKRFFPFEQKLAEFRIPDGYEKAQYSFRWSLKEDRIAVHIIGDADTLWMLADPGPPK